MKFATSDYFSAAVVALCQSRRPHRQGDEAHNY
jgi:hypothetical protein